MTQKSVCHFYLELPNGIVIYKIRFVIEGKGIGDCSKVAINCKQFYILQYIDANFNMSEG